MSLLAHPTADTIVAPLNYNPRRIMGFAKQAETGMTCVGLLGPKSREVHAGFGKRPGHLGNWGLPLRGRAQNGRETKEISLPHQVCWPEKKHEDYFWRLPVDVIFAH